MAVEDDASFSVTEHTPNLADFRDVCEWSMLRSSKMWLSLALYVIVAGAMGLALARSFQTAIVGLLVGLLVWFVVFRTNSELHAQTMLKVRSAFSPSTLTFSENGIRYAAPSSHAEYTWTDFEKAQETQRAFLLTLHYGQVVLIPKSALTPSVDVRLRELLHRRIGEGARRIAGVAGAP